MKSESGDPPRAATRELSQPAHLRGLFEFRNAGQIRVRTGESCVQRACDNNEASFTAGEMDKGVSAIDSSWRVTSVAMLACPHDASLHRGRKDASTIQITLLRDMRKMRYHTTSRQGKAAAFIKPCEG